MSGIPTLTLTPSPDRDFDRFDLEPASRKCPWCRNGRARDGRGEPCDCPDCGGTGWLSTRNLTDDEL